MPTSPAIRSDIRPARMQRDPAAHARPDEDLRPRGQPRRPRPARRAPRSRCRRRGSRRDEIAVAGVVEAQVRLPARPRPGLEEAAPWSRSCPSGSRPGRRRPDPAPRCGGRRCAGRRRDRASRAASSFPSPIGGASASAAQCLEAGRARHRGAGILQVTEIYIFIFATLACFLPFGRGAGGRIACRAGERWLDTQRTGE